MVSPDLIPPPPVCIYFSMDDPWYSPDAAEKLSYPDIGNY